MQVQGVWKRQSKRDLGMLALQVNTSNSLVLSTDGRYFGENGAPVDSYVFREEQDQDRWKIDGSLDDSGMSQRCVKLSGSLLYMPIQTVPKEWKEELTKLPIPLSNAIPTALPSCVLESIGSRPEAETDAKDGDQLEAEQTHRAMERRCCNGIKRWDISEKVVLTVGAAPVDQLLVAQLVRRRDVDDLRRLAGRLRDGVDPRETLEHQLALQLAEPLLVDVEADLERPVAQQEAVVLHRRLVLRLKRQELLIMRQKLMPTVMLPTPWASLNSGASPDISHRYEPLERMLSLCSWMLHRNWLQICADEFCSTVTPSTSKYIRFFGIMGE
uniref:Uncharacterized protein n=1 Tax=Anopheles atroparvus TaxID=41427 RepID=A0A182IS16_ANOAO